VTGRRREEGHDQQREAAAAIPDGATPPARGARDHHSMSVTVKGHCDTKRARRARPLEREVEEGERHIADLPHPAQPRRDMSIDTRQARPLADNRRT
jgi:hypothetical protein